MTDNGSCRYRYHSKKHQKFGGKTLCIRRIELKSYFYLNKTIEVQLAMFPLTFIQVMLPCMARSEQRIHRGSSLQIVLAYDCRSCSRLHQPVNKPRMAVKRTNVLELRHEWLLDNTVSSMLLVSTPDSVFSGINRFDFFGQQSFICGDPLGKLHCLLSNLSLFRSKG